MVLIYTLLWFSIVGPMLAEAGVLSNANVAPASLVAGASGNVNVTFTMANPLPANGKVVITFPSGFDVSTNEISATSSDVDGTFYEATVAGQVLTFERENDGTAEPAGAITITLTNVTNPSVSGATGTFTITTTTAAGAVIDTLASVPLVTISTQSTTTTVVSTSAPTTTTTVESTSAPTITTTMAPSNTTDNRLSVAAKVSTSRAQFCTLFALLFLAYH